MENDGLAFVGAWQPYVSLAFTGLAMANPDGFPYRSWFWKECPVVCVGATVL